MLLKKFKILIYIISILVVLNFILPVFSFAIDEDSIYVWSNNSSTASTTTTTPVKEVQNSTPQENSR